MSENNSNESIDMGVNFDDVPELIVLPSAKYKLRITKATRKDNGGISIAHEVIGHPEAATVFHNLSIPGANAEPAKRDQQIRFIRGYMSAFGIPMNGSNINVNDFAGHEAEVTLTLKERMDKDADGAYTVPTGVFDNVIKVQAK